MDEKNNSYENLPKELKQSGLFCLYKKEEESKKIKKIPYQPIYGNKINTKNKKHFGSFEEALEDYEWIPNNYDGLGILLTDNLCLIDIDNCIYKNELSPLAKKVLELMNSYTEISPSKKGIHILFYCSELKSFPKNKYYIMNPNNRVETYFYNTNRYATLTGNIYDDNHKIINERSKEYKEFLNNFMKRPKLNKSLVKDISQDNIKRVQEVDDFHLMEIMRNSKNGKRFIDVFLYGNVNDFASQSEADIFLAGFLSFFCAKDKERIKRFMKRSALYRDKWDQNRNYLERTISKAIENCTTVYDPNWKGSH